MAILVALRSLLWLSVVDGTFSEVKPYASWQHKGQVAVVVFSMGLWGHVTFELVKLYWPIPPGGILAPMAMAHTFSSLVRNFKGRGLPPLLPCLGILGEGGLPSL